MPLEDTMIICDDTSSSTSTECSSFSSSSSLLEDSSTTSNSKKPRISKLQRHQFFQNILATEGHFLLEDHFSRTFYKKDYFSRTKNQGHFVKDIFEGHS